MARHGENIRKRIDGRWEGRYKVFDENRGEYIYRSVYGRNYEEAKEKLSNARFSLACQGMEKKTAMEAESGSEKSTDGNGDKVLFSQVGGEWLLEVNRRRKYSTYIKYDAIYRTHLADVIGLYRLSSGVTQELQEKIFDHLSRAGLSESLQKSVICVANQILTFANRHYQAGIQLLERPAAKAKKSAVTFSRAEQALLLDCIYRQMDKFKAAVLLCLYTGLRLGELCALQWTDIDFEGKTLTVNRTVQRIAAPGRLTKTILLETTPKSESSHRTIPLTSELLEILSELKGKQPYVFGGKKPLEPRTMQYHFKKILKEAGIKGRSFHTLRHTFATNCMENNMDVKALSELLGHSDVRITLNLYVHPTMDSKRKQIGTLSDFYGQICGRAA
ncbi:MAG: site-specific integrase [Lachnospiraceae bacterium]